MPLNLISKQTYLYPSSLNGKTYEQLVEEDCYNFFKIPPEYQTVKLALLALRKGLAPYELLECLKVGKPEYEEVVWECLKKDVTCFRNVKDPTEDMCLYVVSNDIKNHHCGEDFFLLSWVKKQTQKICDAAIVKNLRSFQEVNPEFQNEEMCCKVMEVHPDLLNFVCKQTPKICLAAIKGASDSSNDDIIEIFSRCEYQTEEMVQIMIDSGESPLDIIMYGEPRTEDIIWVCLKADINCFQCISSPTKEMIKYANKNLVKLDTSSLYKNSNKFYRLLIGNDKYKITNDIHTIIFWLNQKFKCKTSKGPSLPSPFNDNTNLQNFNSDSIQIQILNFGPEADIDDDLTEDILHHGLQSLPELTDDKLSNYEVFPKLPKEILLCNKCDTYYDGTDIHRSFIYSWLKPGNKPVCCPSCDYILIGIS